MKLDLSPKESEIFKEEAIESIVAQLEQKAPDSR
jgi:hypothetical protein